MLNFCSKVNAIAFPSFVPLRFPIASVTFPVPETTLKCVEEEEPSRFLIWKMIHVRLWKTTLIDAFERRILINVYTIVYTMIFNCYQDPKGRF